MTDLRELQRLEARFWRAPSAHNTQPWVLAYGADRVELRYDPERALPAGDPTRRDLMLSLGALVEALLIVAADGGMSVDFDARSDPAAHAVGSFIPAARAYRTVFTSDDVERRQTSRLPYVPGSLSGEELADTRAQLSPNAELHDIATRELVDLVREADRHLYESADVVAELRTWLRLGRRDPKFDQDGLSYDCLALTRLEAAVVSLLLRPQVYPLVRRLGLHRTFGAATTKLLDRDGTALVLAGTWDSPAELLEHGRSLYRVWLALGRRGVYTHPLSQILDCPATESELASRVGVEGEHRLLSVFRAGRSEPPARSRRMR